MGIVTNRYGVKLARKKVPKQLREAVARVTNSNKSSVSWLQRSLGTKDAHEANIRGKPVLMEFDRTLARAEDLIADRPVRASLSATEIKRMAEAHHAAVLARDDAVRREGPWEAHAPEGHYSDVMELSEREVYVLAELPDAQEALAAGNVEHVQKAVANLLGDFGIRLAPQCTAYNALGLAVLREHVRALEAIEARNAGRPVDTPFPPARSVGPIASGETLRAAFEGWKKERERASKTLHEYGRAIDLFVELHGDLPVVQIKRSHARQFREALQDVPRRRTGNLLTAALPELAEWGRAHPEAQKIGPPTINKLFGGVQAVTKWARDKGGIIPDDVPWSDPFSNMRLEEDESGREPFDISELRMLFSSPVFIKGERPKGGRGEAAYWLPLLALFQGARQSELAGLSASDVRTDDETGTTALFITEDRTRGRKLKTKQSQRVIPVHPELVKLGFLSFVSEARKRGKDAWLFPLVAPGTGNVPAWSKWFGRYIREIGISDTDKVFHSLRHNFKDALRRARVSEEINDALTGQAGMRGSVARTYGAKEMILRFGLPALHDAVSAATYHGLDLSKLKRRKH